MSVSKDRWMADWRAAAGAARRLGGTATGPFVEPPATESRIAAVEEELGFRLPSSLREVIGGVGRALTFRWHLEKFKPPERFREIFSGECEWNLDDLAQFEGMRAEWVAGMSEYPDAGASVWENKLAFMHVANGDMIASTWSPGQMGRSFTWTMRGMCAMGPCWGGTSSIS